MAALIAFLLGGVAGLRSLTAPAVLAWAVMGRSELQNTLVAFMARPVTAYVLTALAIAELVNDKLPFTPSRLSAVPLTARVLTGALSGATVGSMFGQALAFGLVLGAAGGVAGAFLRSEEHT